MHTLRRLANAAAGLALEAEMFAARNGIAGAWSAGSQALIGPEAYDRRKGLCRAVRNSEARGWPVFLRRTGGGVVPQGPEVMNIALSFNAPGDFTIEAGYRLITKIIRSGFGESGRRIKTGETPGSFCDGAWNLSVNGRKLAGTAQRWGSVRGGRPRILIHALIITRDDIRPAAEAVSAFQGDLGLGPVAAQAHTSTETEFGLTELPVAALLSVADEAARSLHTAST